MTKKNVLLLEENEMILVNGLPCKVLAVDVTSTGKTAKVFYESNGVADSMRCGTNTYVEIVEKMVEPQIQSKNNIGKIVDPSNNVVSIFQRKEKVQSALETLSKDYQEYYDIIQTEYKQVHDFYLKHILEMPAMARKSLELTMEEMKEAREHLLEKHLTDIGTPMPKRF